METSARDFLARHVILITAIAIFAIVYSVFLTLRFIRQTREGFADTTDEETPLNMPLPLGIFFSKEHCGIIKTAREKYLNLGETSKEAETIANTTKIVGMYDRIMQNLNCGEYLEKLEKGQVEQPKSIRENLMTLEQAMKKRPDFAA